MGKLHVKLTWVQSERKWHMTKLDENETHIHEFFHCGNAQQFFDDLDKRFVYEVELESIVKSKKENDLYSVVQKGK